MQQPHMEEEMEIDLKELFFELLAHWKMIVLSAISDRCDRDACEYLSDHSEVSVHLRIICAYEEQRDDKSF